MNIQRATRNDFRVGDVVTYINANVTYTGTVERVNPQTVRLGSIKTTWTNCPQYVLALGKINGRRLPFRRAERIDR